LQKLEKQRHRCYEELRERIEREKKMKTVSDELELQKHLMVCNKVKKVFYDKLNAIRLHYKALYLATDLSSI